MREFRKAKGVTERYTSLEELRTAFGLKAVRKRTTDAEKLKAQREKFVGTCKVCKQPLSWIEGTNTLACKNPECKGVKMTSKNEDGTDKVWYIPVTRMLDSDGMEIALRLFEE